MLSCTTINVYILTICVSHTTASLTTFDYCSQFISLVEDRIWRADFWNSVKINTTNILKTSSIVSASNGRINTNNTLEISLRNKGKWNGTFHIELITDQPENAFYSSRKAKLSSFDTMFSLGFSRVLYVDGDIIVLKSIMDSTLAPYLDTSSGIWDKKCDIYVQRPSSSPYILNGGVIIGDKKRSKHIIHKWMQQTLSGKFTTDQDAFKHIGLVDGMKKTRRENNQSTYCYLPNDVGYVNSFNSKFGKMSIFGENMCTFLHFKGTRQKKILEKACVKREWPCNIYS